MVRTVLYIRTYCMYFTQHACMVHIHTYVHTDINTESVHVHTNVCTYVRTYVFTHNQCSCVHLHLIYVQCTYIRINIYTCTYVRTYVHTQAHIHLYTHAIHISTTVITFDIRTYQDKCANLPEDGSHCNKNSSTIRWCWYMCDRNSLCWDQCLPLSTRQCLMNEKYTVKREVQ